MSGKVNLSILFLMLISILVPVFAMEFKALTDKNKNYIIIKAEGKIKPYDRDRLKTFLSEPSRKKYKYKYIFLNSTGGKVEEGILLGSYFRKHKIETFIEEEKICASACSYAFFGGTDLSGNKSMTMSAKSLLAIHMLYRGKKESKSIEKEIQRQVIDIFKTALIDYNICKENKSVEKEIQRQVVDTLKIKQDKGIPIDEFIDIFKTPLINYNYICQENKATAKYIQRAVVDILEYSQYVNIPIKILITAFATTGYRITPEEALSYGIKVPDYK